LFRIRKVLGAILSCMTPERVFLLCHLLKNYWRFRYHFFSHHQGFVQDFLVLHTFSRQTLGQLASSFHFEFFFSSTLYNLSKWESVIWAIWTFSLAILWTLVTVTDSLFWYHVMNCPLSEYVQHKLWREELTFSSYSHDWLPICWQIFYYFYYNKVVEILDWILNFMNARVLGRMGWMHMSSLYTMDYFTTLSVTELSSVWCWGN
jgi:hypothetical protein